MDRPMKRRRNNQAPNGRPSIRPNHRCDVPDAEATSQLAIAVKLRFSVYLLQIRILLANTAHTLKRSQWFSAYSKFTKPVGRPVPVSVDVSNETLHMPLTAHGHVYDDLYIYDFCSETKNTLGCAVGWPKSSAKHTSYDGKLIVWHACDHGI